MLAISSCGNFVSAETEIERSQENENENLNNSRNRNMQSHPSNDNQENETIVTARETGYLNITFSDGYSGYCINKDKYSAVKYEKFNVKNTTFAVNSQSHESIGNYLKILFVEYHDNITKNKVDTQNIIWKFSNDNFKESTNPIIQGVLSLANQGLYIPDHGYTKQINGNTLATFDFEVLDSHNNDLQNFFGYKINYTEVIEDIVNETLRENNTTQTPQNNETIPENNTTQTPQNNETIPENNTEEPQPNENKTENDTVIIPETEKNKTEEIIQPLENTSDVPEVKNYSSEELRENKQINLLKHKTGIELPLTLILIAILGGVLYIHCRRD